MRRAVQYYAGQTWAYTYTGLLVTSFLLQALAGLSALAVMFFIIGHMLF